MKPKESEVNEFTCSTPREPEPETTMYILNYSIMDELTDILYKYKDHKPKDFGSDMIERSYPVSAVIEICKEYHNMMVLQNTRPNVNISDE